MALIEDLEQQVKNIFKEQWQTRNGNKVPETEGLKLGNDAVKISGVVLYADLAESTNLVDNEEAYFAAEIYKSYLHCASKVICNEGGAITAFDGDRVMAVFIGDAKNTSAARSALKIYYAVNKIINPAIKVQYPESTYAIKHCVGIDGCEFFVVRTGIRGSNDLVWVGRASNYAAKLCSLRNEGYASYITDRIHRNMQDSTKFSEPDKKAMWEERKWTAKDITVYRSNWTWTI